VGRGATLARVEPGSALPNRSILDSENAAVLRAADAGLSGTASALTYCPGPYKHGADD